MQINVEFTKHFFQSFHRITQENFELTPAAVLILLFEKDSQLHIVLTKRTNSVKHHKGQISFPCGAKDEGDVTIIDTALREAKEEIGLSKKLLNYLAYTMISLHQVDSASRQLLRFFHQ